MELAIAFMVARTLDSCGDRWGAHALQKVDNKVFESIPGLDIEPFEQTSTLLTCLCRIS